MMIKRNRAILCLSVIILCLGLMPLQGHARLVVETKIVSGTITAVKNNAVELDGNGIFYYPAKKNMKMGLGPGKVVTLRYYVDNRDKPINKYIEYAPGADSLAPKAPPAEKRAKDM